MSFETVYPKENEHGQLLCPDCDCDTFKHGPQGGESQNMECVGCETRWNVSFIKGIPWEKLSTVWDRLEKSGV